MLIGRESLVDRIVRAIASQSRVVQVRGVPGVGKSAVVRAAFDRCRSFQERHFLSLDVGSAEKNRALALLGSQRPTLLVIDQLDEDTEFLRSLDRTLEAQAHQQTRLILVVRRGTTISSPAAEVVDVDPLDATAAFRLYRMAAEQSGATMAKINTEHVDSDERTILDAADCLPRSLLSAGHKLVTRTVRGLCEDLVGGGTLVPAPDDWKPFVARARAAEPRLAELAALRGPFPVEAAAAVLRLDQNRTYAIIHDLVGRGIVRTVSRSDDHRATGALYAIFDPAWRILSESADMDASARADAFYAVRAKELSDATFGPNAEAARESVRAEQMQFALTHRRFARERDARADNVAVVRALHSVRLLSPDSAATFFREALAVDVEPSVQRVRLRVYAASTFRRAGNRQGALDQLAQADADSRKIGLALAHAYVAIERGMDALYYDDLVDALAQFRKSAELARTEDPQLYASALAAASIAAMSFDDVGAATAHAEAALIVAKELQLNVVLATCQRALGACVYASGRVRLAKRYFEDALAAASASGSIVDRANAVAALASAMHATGDIDGALVRYREASTFDRPGVAFSRGGLRHLGLVVCLIEKGEFENATNALRPVYARAATASISARAAIQLIGRMIDATALDEQTLHREGLALRTWWDAEGGSAKAAAASYASRFAELAAVPSLLARVRVSRATGALDVAREAATEIADRIGRLGEGVAPWNSISAEFLWLTLRTAHAVLRYVSTPVTEHALVVDGSPPHTFSLDSHDTTSLAARDSLRRVFGALVDKLINAPGDCVPAQALVAVGWPGRVEGELSAADSARLHTAIKRLRDIGLAPILERAAGGYRLSSNVRVVFR